MFDGIFFLSLPNGSLHIAFKIIEWRRDSLTDIYSMWSTTTRDMQIIVEECQNIRPELIVPRDTCVIAGAYIKGLIKGMDEENDPVKIEVFSETVAFATNKKPAIYSPRAFPVRSATPLRRLQLPTTTAWKESAHFVSPGTAAPCPTPAIPQPPSPAALSAWWHCLASSAIVTTA